MIFVHLVHIVILNILPRQRLFDTHNSLHIVGLHEDDYVSCLSFIDEYETIFKPRYACYEFTLGEKIVGSHHGSKSGYLAPLLFAVAFIIHVFIAIVHHIKAKNYAHKLLHRFIDVTPKSTKRRINLHDGAVSGQAVAPPGDVAGGTFGALSAGRACAVGIVAVARAIA